MATKKRMSGMKLSDFGGQPTTTPEPVPTAPPPKTNPKRSPQPKEEKLVTVNIKIKESQQEWLADTAKQVRQNNDTPVPASERVYPQHLIQTAIDFLEASPVDWAQVKNIEDLRQALDL